MIVMIINLKEVLLQFEIERQTEWVRTAHITAGYISLYLLVHDGFFSKEPSQLHILLHVYGFKSLSLSLSLYPHLWHDHRVWMTHYICVKEKWFIISHSTTDTHTHTHTHTPQFKNHSKICCSTLYSVICILLSQMQKKKKKKRKNGAIYVDANCMDDIVGSCNNLIEEHFFFLLSTKSGGCRTKPNYDANKRKLDVFDCWFDESRDNCFIVQKLCLMIVCYGWVIYHANHFRLIKFQAQKTSIFFTERVTSKRQPNLIALIISVSGWE